MGVLVRALSAGFLAASVAVAAAAESAPAAPKHVLILYDEDKDNFPGLASIDRSLRASFETGLRGAVEIHSESMGLSEFERPGYEAMVADFYRGKYGKKEPDLVIAVVEPSLDFLLRHAETLFPGVPIVFAGVDATAIEGKTLPATVTGVLLRRTFSPTLEVALRLQPDTRHVFVVGGAARFDRYLQTLVRRDLQPFERRIAIEYLFGLTMEDTLARVSRLPPHSVILYVTVFTDGAGRGFIPHEALSSIAAAANAPTYVFLDQFVGRGAVGGNVYSTETHAAHVAALGMQILAATSPATLPVRAPPAQVDMFDARQLKRWKLDDRPLPAGSDVRFEEPSAWQQYRWYIAGTIAILITQAVLIGGLLLARARQRNAEAEALRQRDDLAHVLRVNTLGELTSELAHELSQPLSAIMLNSRAAIRFLARGKPDDAREVDEALGDIVANAHHASSVLARVRTLFRKERVEQICVNVRTLIEDVVRLLHAAMLIERIDIQLKFADDLPAIFGDPVQLEQVLLNVVRNACDAIGAANAGPRIITIETRRAVPDGVIIEIADTGVGADAAQLESIFEHFVTTKPSGLGMGLAISRSIITAHGGRIWATANPDRGLTVHIELVAWAGSASSTQQEAMQASGEAT